VPYFQISSKNGLHIPDQPVPVAFLTFLSLPVLCYLCDALAQIQVMELGRIEWR